jgi:hypothetical protein
MNGSARMRPLGFAAFGWLECSAAGDFIRHTAYYNINTLYSDLHLLACALKALREPSARAVPPKSDPSAGARKIRKEHGW